MIYVLAFFFPFVALALKGMYIQAACNFLIWIIALVLDFTAIGLVIGVPLGLVSIVWAWVSIAQKVNKERHLEMLGAVAAGNANAQGGASQDEQK
ncbi:MAG: hypothetical protein J1E28_00430 [Helicobacter sp.]|uniref:hypothetical protein n=1 Tax=Helicobacter sp. TaxID=218 RepID=UPI0025C28BD9|nr:hypothetical protein [Helicobacter sp.]MCH5312855.1 hypothetical protein [Helicobacter sp.]